FVSGCSGGAVTSISLIEPGFGFSTTAPAVTISGGGGTGATATSALSYPFGFSMKTPQPGTIPVEACCELVNALPRCAGWFVINENASDDHVDAFCDVV